MEVVDELDTPGCPQCAVKHLCAALSYAADHNQGDEQMGEEFVLAARALINLAEVAVGYGSHYDFAIGLLERAEREYATTCGPVSDDFSLRVRDLRIAMIRNDPEAQASARRTLHARIHPSSYMWAHLVEAARELPGMHIPTVNPAVPEIQGILQAVRDEYFNLPEVTGTEGEKTTKEKEPDMATKKKAVACKGAKCAAKGGKTAKTTKCACKGGKAKK